MLAQVGCHRQYYRKQADCEAHSLIAEKASHVARAPNIAIHVDVDRRSRMFNPFDVDFQPMPLDDPASYQYMQCVDGRRGYPMWEAAGVTNTAESPDWWEFLPLNEDGVLVLNADTAVRIALLHSPDYQAQIEQLYLSALQVSAQRFEFDTQFFGGTGGSFLRTGADRGDNSTFTLGSAATDRNRTLSLNRRFAAGGNLIAGMANNIVWELSGPNQHSVSTAFDFAFLQPLLRLAGRDVVLEDLTAAERALLANVRSFERYRRSFYLNVTVGRPIESTVQLGPTTIAGIGNTGFGAGGFLGLLQSQLQIRNSEENISRQAENLQILQASLIEGLTTIPEATGAGAGQFVTDRLQVAQARSGLLNSQSALVNQQANYQRSLDQFLRTLGLPPYICAELDDPILNQFELIDRTLRLRNEELIALRASLGDTNVSILELGVYEVDPDTGIPVAQLNWTDALSELITQLRKEAQPLANFTRDLIETDLPVVEKDIETLSESVSKRTSQNASLEQLYRREQESICGLLNLSQIDESIFAVDELEGLSTDLKIQFGELKQRLKSYEQRIKDLDEAFAKLMEEGSQIDDPKKLAARLRDDVVLASQDLVAELGDDILTMQLIQARARTESVLLPNVDIDPETAVRIARKNRRDWANARATLVDSWRDIEVVADSLESNLDLEISGSIANVGNNPVNFRGRNGQVQVGLQWDAPITRLNERNAYRSALIDYERTKRDYYQFEDGVWQLLRAEVRQLHANRMTFELGRQAVRIAAEQIELNAFRRANNEARGVGSGPTAARDAIDALSALLNAQNQLLNIYVNFEVVRRGLDFDMGTMELTPDGQWIDPNEFSTDIMLGLAGTTDGGMVGCNDCCLPNMRLPVEPDYRWADHGQPVATPDPRQRDVNRGLLESDAQVKHNPVHVARLPEAWQNESDFDDLQDLPELVRPKIEIRPSIADQIGIEEPIDSASGSK